MTEWPVDFDGIAETVVLTEDPDGRWNVAALGVRSGTPATARTWGNTKTWRNFERTGEGVVAFVQDPVVFVEAALTESVRDDAAVPSADAWATVSVEEVDRGQSGGTMWVDWALEPVESVVENRTVRVTNRGFNAIIEMTVAASRLDVPSYDDESLRSRLRYFEGVVETCGGDRELEALSLLRDLTEW